MITTPEQLLLFGALDGSVSARAWNSMAEAAKGTVELCSLDLSGYDLRGLSFSNCDLSGARFIECRAHGVQFEGAIIDNVDFSRTELDKASFVRARGEHVRFVGSSMDKTDFSWAKLPHADFTSCRIDLAKFWKTDLRGSLIDPTKLHRDSDCLLDDSNGQRVTLREALARIGGLTGCRYRLDGKVPNGQIDLPDDFDMRPKAALKQLCKALGLEVRKNRQFEIYEVVPKQLGGTRYS